VSVIDQAKAIDTEDKVFLLGALVAPALVWWLFTGRKKYTTKGMTK
jgi:hypothetical protein